MGSNMLQEASSIETNPSATSRGDTIPGMSKHYCSCQINTTERTRYSILYIIHGHVYEAVKNNIRSRALNI